MIIDHLFTRPLFESQTDHITQFASNAHEEWRRKFDPTGTKPRIKKNSDGTEGDINVPFEKLHPDWKKENLAAAHAAHHAVKHFGRDMEKAAEHVHNEWMKRNPKADYNAAQHVPYDDLSDDEKEKDRVHVRTMMRLMGHHPEQVVAEVAPPGDKAERMVKHIKQGYAKDGKLTPKEKGIAYATAWKAHNAGRVEEATDPTRAKLERMIYKYYGQIYDYGDDDGLDYLDRNGELWNQLMDKYDGEIEDIVAREPTEVLMQAAQELKGIAGDMKYELDEAGVAEGYQDDSKEREENLRYSRSRNPVADAIRKKLNPNQKEQNKEKGVAEESEKNPHTSALGKALWRDLSKEKKASPAQVEKNKARWAQRQADKEQGVAEGYGQKPTITYKDLTLQYDYQTEDDDPEGYSTATTYYFDVFKDGKRVGEAEYFDYFGNLKIRIHGKTKEFGFRHPLASQISQLVSSLPDEQKKDLSDPRFESQGVAEGSDDPAKDALIQALMGHSVDDPRELWVDLKEIGRGFKTPVSRQIRMALRSLSPDDAYELWDTALEIAGVTQDELDNMTGDMDDLRDVSPPATGQKKTKHKIHKTIYIESQGVAEGSLNEYRDRLLQYVKSLLPTWPEYVLKDWLVPNKGDFSNLPDTELKNGIMEKLKLAGLTPNTKWQLVPNMKFTMDMFEPMTTKRLIGRAGGHSDMGLNVPRDKERHATQAALAQQQGGVRKEPVLLIKTSKGYELLEGWHRTIQHFAKYPQGYTGPAYVAVAQGQQGVAEGRQIDEVFANQGSGSTDRDNADYMKRRNAAKKAGYTGRETKAGTWRVFKDGNAVAAAGPFKSADEAAAWIKKHKQGITEMDKSEPSAGRDTGPRPGPDREAKPIPAKKATKDAAGMLNRAVKDSHKKKDVKESDPLMLKLQRALIKEGRVKELADDLKTMSDSDFMKKYGKAKAAIRRDMKRVDEAADQQDAAGQQFVGTGRSRNWQMSVDKAAQDARIKAAQSIAGTNNSPNGVKLPSGTTYGPQDTKSDGTGGYVSTYIITLPAPSQSAEPAPTSPNAALDNTKGSMSTGTPPAVGSAAGNYMKVNELSNNKLAQYKTAAAKDAKKADQAGDVKRGDRRFHGMVQATKKQFDKDAKKVDESRAARRALMAQIVNGG